MTADQITLFAILAVAVVLFMRGRWRHDVVALGALLACVATGLVPAEGAFSGFANPAVITVACVLVLSRGLQDSGAVDLVAQRLLPSDATPTMMIAGLSGLATALSAVMNNVGALALLMPVALRAAGRLEMPPGRLLMPLAFGSILGGMTTLIGTPPNLIVAGYRAETLGAPFKMFDFTPVGLAIALIGLGFVVLVGWRLVPERKRAGVEGFDAGAYITEAEAPEGAKAVGMTLRGVEDALEGSEAQVLGLIRRDVRLRAPRSNTKVREGDVLVLEAEPEGLSAALSRLGLKLSTGADGTPPKADPAQSGTGEGEARLSELVVPPGAALIGRSAESMHLRMRYRMNLLALSREGTRRIGRLRRAAIRAGDVLLVQGTSEAISEFASDCGALPLTLPDRRHMMLATGILLGSVLLAASGVTTAPVAFAAGALAAMVTGVVSPERVYRAIDWPVVVLLACLLPVAGAMLTTGAADLVAGIVVEDIARGAPILSLVLVLVVTMTLSDVMNNAATVAVMAPVALGAAQTLEANPDAFLMAVAIGGSCAFLTPIGHQNNTLILGPGGFRFGDYWRLGVPLEIIVTVVGIPMILLVWGL